MSDSLTTLDNQFYCGFERWHYVIFGESRSLRNSQPLFPTFQSVQSFYMELHIDECCKTAWTMHCRLFLYDWPRRILWSMKPLTYEQEIVAVKRHWFIENSSSLIKLVSTFYWTLPLDFSSHMSAWKYLLKTLKTQHVRIKILPFNVAINYTQLLKS